MGAVVAAELDGVVAVEPVAVEPEVALEPGVAAERTIFSIDKDKIS